MLPFLAEQASPAAGPAPRGRSARLPGASGAVLVEQVDGLAIEPHLAAWSALAARALEPNAFMEPGFAFAAVLHLPPAQRPGFLLCWEPDADGEPVLIGLLALAPRSAVDVVPVARAWTNPQWVASAPLLHRTRAAAAFDAMMGWLAARRATRGGLLLGGVPRDGALMRLVEDGGRRATAPIAVRERAVLEGGRPHEETPERARKHAKELRRQTRRLGGVLRSANTPEEVRAATERFLELEARGWKGGRGTALLADSHLATFTRTMTRLLASQGLCQIHTLEVDGQAAAVGIVLRSGDRAFYWKTAYDEARRQLSPGKQLAAMIGELHRRDPGLALTDSCAVPDHPMINKVWEGRMDVVDVLVACPGRNRRSFAWAVAALGATGRLRAQAKAMRNRLRDALRD